MGKVLITDLVHQKLIIGLEDMGFEVDYRENFDPKGLDEILPSLSGVVINSKIIMNAERIRLAKNLQFIARLGSGLEIIDLKAAKLAGVPVYNSPEGNRNAVAEHAMGMLLCLCNNLLKADSEVRAKVWKREENRGLELAGRSLGIIGFGNTGQSLARKLSGWALDLCFYDPYLLEVPKEFSNIEKVSLEKLIETSNIISLHVPLTSETRGMVDKEFLQSCSSDTIIINTSRGKVVETKAIIEALKDKSIFGACLDVFENEKPHSFTPEEDQHYTALYSLENVVLSPHVAGWTHASLRKIAEVLLDKIGQSVNT